MAFRFLSVSKTSIKTQNSGLRLKTNCCYPQILTISMCVITSYLCILKILNAILVDPNAWTKAQLIFCYLFFRWVEIFGFSHNTEFWVLINVSDILKNLHAILSDTNAWTKVQFYFQLFILGWATIFSLVSTLNFEF